MYKTVLSIDFPVIDMFKSFIFNVTAVGPLVDPAVQECQALLEEENRIKFSLLSVVDREIESSCGYTKSDPEYYQEPCCNE